MSQKIPFLEMFAALNQWQEFVNAMEGWLIVEAAIDRKTRSAVVTVEGASGAGPNLIAQAEEVVARCYGLNSVKLKPITEERPKAVEPEVPQPAPAPQTEAPKAQEEQPAAASAQPQKPQEPQDAFARAEAIRAAALKKVKRAAPSASGKKGEKKDNGRVIFGKVIKRAPVSIGELELDMGMVVIEGDVFAIENRELKKRNSWVVAFDVTD